MKFALLLTALLFSHTSNAQTIEYKVADKTYEGVFEAAQGTNKGLVILIHDWDGLTDYEVKRSQMLSKLGYDTFAVDLYGKGNRPVEMQMKKSETAKLYQDREKMRQLILAGVSQAQQLSNNKSMVVMGYCFGGAAVLELARSGKGTGVKGYASFHGGLATPEGQNYSAANAPILIAHGGADAGIPMTDVAQLSVELEQAKVDYEIQVYSGAPHAFTVFGSDRYQQQADEKSWAAMLQFLDKQL
ncbi:dienelactone hydrolase family protein [Motilimonas cestriensis]|uniref:Dienelactone hydrolase family protein n=1 Tax=Motilimonas cestriensis TaxID=2742685 RepID=A0ABS8W4M1_9GAMM|nr:dienelactone hydrolase family protein [Motilimonas cestriensis]MCE2593327.1 dienelactone hydrolase family protein [Motilimonas cestriensis]